MCRATAVPSGLEIVSFFFDRVVWVGNYEEQWILPVHGRIFLLCAGRGAGSGTVGGDLGELGVKVVQNESFTRAGLVRLAESIRKAAIADGLAENAST